MSTLEDIYQNLLGRAPEAGAENYYAGMTPTEITEAVNHSPEALTRVANQTIAQQQAATPTPTPNYNMSFDPVYGARVDSGYMDILKNALATNQTANPSVYGGMSLQDFDKSINPESYYARWGGGNPNTSGAPNYTWNTQTGMKGLNSLNSYLQGTPDYTPTNASPMFQSTPGLKNVFNPQGTVQNGQSNIQNWLKPYMDQLKSMQNQMQGNQPAGTPSYMTPNSSNYNFRTNQMGNSRGARYFNQNTNQYDTNTSTMSDSF